MEKILVLMSTYNGEKYLREQIESILNQTGLKVSLLVRDDGSKDRTLDILEHYHQAQKLTYYSGDNLGPARSFLHLLQHAPDYDYYAFADQDDVWKPEKLQSGVNAITKQAAERAALYFSQTQLTDKSLNPIPSVIIHPKLTFGEMLVYKFIGGCTMVINHQLRQAIGSFEPDYMPMHDIWIYSIAQAIGAKIIFDPIPHILYRQHGNNTVGQGQGFLYEWQQRLKRFISKPNERYNQALQLANGYKDVILPQNARLLQRFLDGKQNLVKRLSLITNPELRCADTITQLLFWCNVLLNKY